MGLIKSTEQSNGNMLLEILYGGKEAPFGGVDTSAPPAYIDPRCFVNADGFLIIDNKLITVNLQPVTTPTLWSGTSGVTLLKFGTFYNSLNGQLNYAFGYKCTVLSAPSGVAYTFYMTAWNPAIPGTPLNDVLTLTLYDGNSIVQQASITLDCIQSGSPSGTVSNGGNITVTGTSGGGGALTTYTFTGGTGYVAAQVVQVIQVTPGIGVTASSALIKIDTVSGGGGVLTSHLVAGGTGYYLGRSAYPGNIQTSSIVIAINGTPYSIPSTNPVAYTRQAIVGALVTAINSAPDPNVTASASLDGYSLILTAIVYGPGGNTITVQDQSVASAPGYTPAFYFSCVQARTLQGGQISETSTAPRFFNSPSSTTEVGGTLYIAGLGPMILQYSGPGEFTTATLYNGVAVIKKFAGSLLGLRYQQQLGTYTQNQDMILVWSSSENLNEWSPVTNVGNVTGAGFEQLADIGDYLSGLVVTNGTAFIIRSQGISYATATGNATLPYAVNHIGLGDRGEGAQVSNLICQYDQVGAYVGNSDIFQISGQVSSIGAKIKNVIFAALQNNPGNLNSEACCVFIGNNEVILVVFQVAQTLYIFNTANGTWMTLGFTAIPGGDVGALYGLGCFTKYLGFSSSNLYNPSSFVVGVQYINSLFVVQPPAFYTLGEGIVNSTSLTDSNTVTFPVEEIDFGRDVTIDSIYLSLWANVSENTFLTFYITGTVNIAAVGDPEVYVPTTVTYATLELTPAVFNSLIGDPIELQLYPTTSFGAGAVTIRSPQLSIAVTPILDTGTAQIRFSKKAIFATIDPNQRPV
jgi:hypothetical protein